jgi:aryl-alcohol dehydrogenase-like predicted oxidoreductase
VATAIIGASKPEQVYDNAAAAGVRLPDELLKRIDEILDPVIERDPAKTSESSPKEREA